MKKLMFNDKYGLTQAVLKGRKTQTRRIVNPTMLFERLGTYEGWAKESIADWKESCKAGLYKAEGEELQIMLDYALEHSPYKVGETIAIAQRYEDMEKDDDFFRFCSKNGILLWDIIYEKGCFNKMFVRADLMLHHIIITNIRVERLQEISNGGCLKEGIWRDDNVGHAGPTYWYHGLANSSFHTPQEAYASLIDRISGKGIWKSNPYVYVYDFELID